MFFFTVLLPLVLYVGGALAYIPATPTNDTDPFSQEDASHITLKYKPSVSMNDLLNLMILRLDSSGTSEGAMVQFSENGLTSDGTLTPWIAVVNCDTNATGSSPSVDIFTLARKRGATGAILYSRTSQGCQLNPVYDDMDAELDVYMPENNAKAQQLLLQFDHLPNASYIDYNPALLNQSSEAVQASLSGNNDVTSNFMVASLRAPDSFFVNDTNVNGTDTTPVKHSSNPNTGLAMIILYAITGCVSALFIIVILSGAIRAIRHPERYGPRAAGVNGRGLPVGGQTRTGGLGRAILDTFPVIKFNQTSQADASAPSKDDLEHSAVELSARSPINDDSKDEKTGGQNTTNAHESDGKRAISPSSSSVRETEHNKDHTPDDPKPSAMGHETCPICIVDFEEGDDIRVLPCEGKHQFHQACVDPWLLELSSSCPLCREDFHALETMLSGETAQEESNNEQTGRSHRFTRYLGFARRRRGSMRRAGQPAGPGEGENPPPS